MRHRNQQSGFALLITLIVVSVLVSVGLTILDVSIKQLRLSTNSRDSEIAFHAANAGLECARYWRRVSSSTMEAGQQIQNPFTSSNLSCFNVSATANIVEIVPLNTTTGAGAWQYNYRFSWPSTNPDRCTVVQTLVMKSAPDSPLSVNNMQSRIQGFPDGDTKTCEAGGRCTVMSVQGHNRPCPSGSVPFPLGTVQREVLLQF